MKANETHLIGALTLAALATSVSGKSAEKRGSSEPKRPNVLLIVCDDLRPELGCYGNRFMQTPNMDRLAAEGVVFSRAYCNIPVSGASRASFLTGMRPTRDLFEFWNLRVDKEVPEAITLNQAFKEAGYTTISNGKIFHHQDEASNRYWDEILRYGNPLDYHSEENQAFMRIQQESKTRKRGLFYEAADCPDSLYIDWKVAQESLKDLRAVAQNKAPFFMAVGFVRPHLPFTVPKKYWDLYNPQEIELPDNYVLKAGHDIPSRALTHWGELMAYRGVPEQGPLSHDAARRMIHGYRASVSYVDHLIGTLLDEAERLGLLENTIVMLIGDHGWNLGEHGMWCKHSIMHTSLHVPLIVRTPDGLQGFRNHEVVEYVDLFPTLCDLAGLPHPDQLEGESFAPLLKDPSARSKGYAISRWENGFTYTDGHYSYTEWWDQEDQTCERMLFDLVNDPDENYNVAESPLYRNTVQALSETLRHNRGKRFLSK